MRSPDTAPSSGEMRPAPKPILQAGIATGTTVVLLRSAASAGSLQRRRSLTSLIVAGLAALAVASAIQLTSGSREGSAGDVAGSPSATALKKAGLLAIPVPARALISSTLGVDDAAYRFKDLSAVNAAQGLSARFSAGGARISSRGASFVLGLRAYGRGSTVHPLSAVAPHVGGNLVRYQHPGVLEQWSNGPLGLEQTITLGVRPRGTGSLALIVAMPAGTRLDHGALTLPGGLRYTAPRVTDAKGRRLPARLEQRGRDAAIVVDDSNAHYPVTVDPFVQQAQLSPADGEGGDQFGYSVAVDGSTIVVGAQLHTTNGQLRAGAAYVFQAGPSGWSSGTQTAELTASDAGALDELGYSVAVSGNTIVVGAPYWTDFGNYEKSCGNPKGTIPGSAYVYTMPAGGWHNMTQTVELTPKFAGFCNGAAFGTSVDISENTIVVGAPALRTKEFENTGGGAYVYTMPPGGWAGASTPAGLLTSTDQEARSRLGFSVAVSGDTIVAGDSSWNGTGYYGEGSAYVYTKPPGGWTDNTQTTKLDPSDAGPSDDFGTSVAIDGSTVAVGAPRHGAGESLEGALYVFQEPGGGWPSSMSQTSELKTTEGAGTYLGFSVGISGGTVVGGPAVDSGVASSGAAFVFTEPTGGWPASMTQTEELTETPAEHGTEWGEAAAISGSTIVVGAYGGTPGGVSVPPSSGLANVFVPGTIKPPSSGGSTVTSGGSPTAPGTAKVLSASVHASSVGVKVSCTGASGAKCSVSFALSAVETLRGHRIVGLAAAKPRKHMLTLAAASKRLTAGQTLTVTLGLSGTGKSLLARFHRLPAKLVASQALANGKPASFYAKALTFLPAKKHKKK